jgi:hypothetical protein
MRVGIQLAAVMREGGPGPPYAVEGGLIMGN